MLPELRWICTETNLHKGKRPLYKGTPYDAVNLWFMRNKSSISNIIFKNMGKYRLIFYFLDKLNVKPLELSSFNTYFLLQEDKKERYYLSNLKNYIFSWHGLTCIKTTYITWHKTFFLLQRSRCERQANFCAGNKIKNLV